MSECKTPITVIVVPAVLLVLLFLLNLLCWMFHKKLPRLVCDNRKLRCLWPTSDAVPPDSTSAVSENDEQIHEDVTIPKLKTEACLDTDSYEDVTEVRYPTLTMQRGKPSTPATQRAGAQRASAQRGKPSNPTAERGETSRPVEQSTGARRPCELTDEEESGSECLYEEYDEDLVKKANTIGNVKNEPKSVKIGMGDAQRLRKSEGAASVSDRKKSYFTKPETANAPKRQRMKLPTPLELSNSRSSSKSKKSTNSPQAKPKTLESRPQKDITSWRGTKPAVVPSPPKQPVPPLSIARKSNTKKQTQPEIIKEFPRKNTFLDEMKRRQAESPKGSRGGKREESRSGEAEYCTQSRSDGSEYWSDIIDNESYKQATYDNLTPEREDQPPDYQDYIY